MDSAVSITTVKGPAAGIHLSNGTMQDLACLPDPLTSNS